MQAKLINDAGEKTFALVFATGEEAKAGLTAFAKERGLAVGRFTAIGAFSDVTLGFFDWATKRYRTITVDEQVEVLSLVGDVAHEDGEPKVHAHGVVGKADGTAHGGHLMAAHTRPTLEVIVVESPAQLRRRFDPESGLALISVEEEPPATAATGER